MVSPIFGMPIRAEGEIGDEDAENGHCLPASAIRLIPSGGITPFVKTKQP